MHKVSSFAEIKIQNIDCHQNANSRGQTGNQPNNQALTQMSQLKESFTQKIGLITVLVSKSKKKTQLIKLVNDSQISQNLVSSGPKISNQTTEPVKKMDEMTIELVQFSHYHSVIQTQQEKFILRKSMFKKQVQISDRSSYMSCLSQVRFKFVKHFDLSSCRISSIEVLSFFDIPLVQRLEIQHNHISNLNVLNKCQFKHLKYISWYDNDIVQFSLAFRANLPTLNRIVADSDKNHKNKAHQNSLYHIDPIFKSQNLLGMQQLKINIRTRILTQKLKQTFRAVNPMIKLKRKITSQDLMNRLERLGGIGTTNDPIVFRQFLINDLQPILTDRERNPQYIPAINQIRQGLWLRLLQLQASLIKSDEKKEI